MVALLINDEKQVRFANDDGEWSILKNHFTSPNGQKWAGPGYIYRFKETKTPQQRLWVEDLNQPGGTSINDPDYGGLGCFGIQWARNFGETIEKWDLNGRMDGTVDGFGVSGTEIITEPYVAESGIGYFAIVVSFRDGWTDPLLKVTYDYEFHDSQVALYTTVETGPPAGPGATYVKEPKFVASVAPQGGPDFEEVKLFNRAGGLIATYDLSQIKDPGKSTIQLAQNARARARFGKATAQGSIGKTFNLIAGDGHVFLGDWEGGVNGLDAWAVDANNLPRLSEEGESYCLNPAGNLKRRWEIAKRGTSPKTNLMFHSWEGGFGYPDCEKAARTYIPGMEYRNYFRWSLGTGWTI